MAREIVITSVPRGVKVGRTGFQVAMQTAGLRDDLVAMLEKMAGYRHLPAGSGPNPVTYFHRIARTLAGPAHVLGRIVDAGVDFSKRSNKLAHMVILEPTDVGFLGKSSPATTLLSIEGRLATSWPGKPEERATRFPIVGIPPSFPAVCSTWQHVKGDAGWAGVLADRAVRSQPTLVIGSNSSPASCRQMLVLFQEALAIVPPAKQWLVTFDTTSLTMDGILWRGTYAGSPESQASQPGLLVIDLARPGPVPTDLAASDLVQLARTGRGAVRLQTPTEATFPSNRSRPDSDVILLETVPSGTDTERFHASGVSAAPPPPPSSDDAEWEEISLSGKRSTLNGGALTFGILAAVLVFLGLITAGGITVALMWPSQRRPAPEQHASDAGQPQPNDASKTELSSNESSPPAEKQIASASQDGAIKVDSAQKNKDDDTAEQEKTDAAQRVAVADSKAFNALQAWIQSRKQSPDRLWPPQTGDSSRISIPDLAPATSNIELIVASTAGFETNVVAEQSRSPETFEGWTWGITASPSAPDVPSLGPAVAFVEIRPDFLEFRANTRPLDPLFSFMPMRFSFTGIENAQKTTDWFVLDIPAEVQLDASPTLHDLFFGDQQEIHINLNKKLPDNCGIAWEALSIDRSLLKITLGPQPEPKSSDAPAYELKLAITADIYTDGTDPHPYSLTENVRVHFNSQQGLLTCRYEGRNWSDRKDRLVDTGSPGDEATKLRVSPAPKFTSDADVKNAKETLTRVTHCLLLEAALVLDPDFDQKKFTYSIVDNNNLHDKWARNLTDDSKITLGAWRESLLRYLRGNSDYSENLLEQYKKKKPRPVAPDDLREEPALEAEDYKLWEAEKAAHDEALAAIDEWQKDCDAFIDKQTRNLESLRTYRESVGKPTVDDTKDSDKSIDAELAAIDVLLGLDGLIVALVHKDLEDILEKIPIATLLSGTATTKWSFDDGETALVPVAEIIPLEQSADDKPPGNENTDQEDLPDEPPPPSDANGTSKQPDPSPAVNNQP